MLWWNHTYAYPYSYSYGYGHRDTSTDTDGDGDSYRYIHGCAYPNTMLLLQRELRWGDSTRLARRLGGDQCRWSSATVGYLDYYA